MAEHAEVSTCSKGVVEIESRDGFIDETTKEVVRLYFAKIDCSLRVLGSQFGLEPSRLTDLIREYLCAHINGS